MTLFEQLQGDLLGWTHLVSALLALATGCWLVLRRKGGSQHLGVPVFNSVRFIVCRVGLLSHVVRNSSNDSVLPVGLVPDRRDVKPLLFRLEHGRQLRFALVTESVAYSK